MEVLSRSGLRSWGAEAGPVLTMPGRSAYLGSAMAAARRGWGTGASVKPGRCSGKGEAGSGSRAKAAAKGAAEEVEEQEVSRQKSHGREKGKAKVARTGCYHTPGEPGIGVNEARG